MLPTSNIGVKGWEPGRSTWCLMEATFDRARNRQFPREPDSNSPSLLHGCPDMTSKTHAAPPAPPRERIIAAAAELFQKHGIRGIGVDAIAEAAGTNKMTLYRHFASKDELIAEWARGIVAQKEAEWEELGARHPNDPQGHLIEWSRRVASKLAD